MFTPSSFGPGAGEEGAHDVAADHDRSPLARLRRLAPPAVQPGGATAARRADGRAAVSRVVFPRRLRLLRSPRADLLHAQARRPHLWALPHGPVLTAAVYVMMGLAFVLIAAGLIQPSPAFVVPGDAAPRAVHRITRHPVM